MINKQKTDNSLISLLISTATNIYECNQYSFNNTDLFSKNNYSLIGRQTTTDYWYGDGLSYKRIKDDNGNSIDKLALFNSKNHGVFYLYISDSLDSSIPVVVTLSDNEDIRICRISDNIESLSILTNKYRDAELILNGFLRSYKLSNHLELSLDKKETQTKRIKI